MPPRNVDRLTRIYGPSTWDVYEKLDLSLDPPGPESLFEVASRCLDPGDRVLDAGCRDASHLIRLVRDNSVDGVGVEPVPVHVERARAAVAAAGMNERVQLHLGVIHELPYPDDFFDLVWCRDVVEQLDDLDGALAELRRVLGPSKRMIVYTVFETERLEGADAEMMRRHLGNVEANLDRRHVESAFRSAGFSIEQTDVIGTMWREHVEERTSSASRALLRLARLRRQRETIVTAHGHDIYDHIEANLHWEVFVFLGKLVPVVYVLRK